ncbi:MAG: DUF63 family protein [Candidatus Thalassarchaeaceae archaeon]|nr:MAG: DUF63 family protein [Candidatus Poseidoniales archaeon]|tara:strand:- start:3077 stop:4357 length:1281 start_codon:yes stop_codon:yes gene_type:complete
MTGGNYGLYDYERWSIYALTAITTLIFSALFLNILDISNPLTDFITDYYVNPVLDESGGDAGYNVTNTITYAVVLALFVAALSAWLRILEIDPSDATLLALLPYVFWAALGEVVEDANMFDSSMAPLFVSPSIHFQTALWVIIAGSIGYHVRNYGSKISDSEKDRILESLCMIVIFVQFLIFGHSISSSEIGSNLDLTIFAVIGISATLIPIFFRESTSEFSYIQKSVYLVGCGGILVFFGALVSFATSLPEDKLTLWPLVIVIGIPLVICYAMFSTGIESSRRLSERGFVAGILPEGMSETDYEDLVSVDKTFMEENRKKAVLAYPVVFLSVSGQVMDGLATWIGIEYFGYDEKHLLSARIIEEFGNTFGFTMVKAGLGIIIWWFFAYANFENKQQHLRLLVGLMILVVGMAPGLRGVGRLVIGQ